MLVAAAVENTNLGWRDLAATAAGLTGEQVLVLAATPLPIRAAVEAAVLVVAMLGATEALVLS
jgi:hypothetical protein